MDQTRKTASSQQSDQWTQIGNGVWLPKYSMKQTPIAPPSKQGRRQHLAWTQRQVAGKTLWDWMSLLLVPLLIGIGTILVMNRQNDLIDQLHQHDEKIAQQAQWDDLLRQYRDGIDTLLLSNGLRQSHPGDDVSEVAHARTLDILEAVDPSRRGSVIAYLSNLKLVQGGFYDGKVWHQQKMIVSLWGADLSGANLFEADLSGANLKGADLNGAYLKLADFKGSDLERSDLERSDLEGSDLKGANLKGADLEGADLEGADLKLADLKEADLKLADLTTQQLDRVYSLSGTTLPNGFHCTMVPDLSDKKKQAENRDACLHKAGYL